MKSKLTIIFLILIIITGCAKNIKNNSKNKPDNVSVNDELNYTPQENNPDCVPPGKFTNQLGMEFVFIPNGSFMMGTSDNQSYKEPNESYHKVVFTKGFYMQTKEVSQGQWVRLMGKNPSFFKQCGNSCPVENVTWEETGEFIKRLNELEQTNLYRLPTESEWEYVCKTGNTYSYEKSCGEKECEQTDEDGFEKCDTCGLAKDLDNISWYFRNSRNLTHPSGMKSPNKYGIYDMIGNVWEWCYDWHAEYPMEKVTTDPMGPEYGDTKIRRGGAWNHYGKFNRCSYRSWKPFLHRQADTGFRLIKEINYEQLCNNDNTSLENSDNASAIDEIKQTDAQSYFNYEYPVIFFDLGSSKIRTGMKDVLDKIAEKINNDNKTVEIEGFTCDLASEKFNFELGRQRAKAVQDYLIEQGVSEDLLKIKSFGETNPKYPNTSEFNRRLNRRVEIKYFNE